MNKYSISVTITNLTTGHAIKEATTISSDLPLDNIADFIFCPLLDLNEAPDEEGDQDE